MQAAAAQTGHWYIARAGQQYGPITDLELGKMVELRHLHPDDFLWREGFDDWVEARRIPGLLPAGPPPPPPPSFRQPSDDQRANAQSMAASPAPLATSSAPMSNTYAVEADPRRPLAATGSESTGLAMATYICLLLPIPPLPLIGLIIAIVNRNSEPAWLASHYKWQIKTFLKQLLFVVVGLLLLFVFVGSIILLATVVWTLVRYVRGISALSRREAMPNIARWGW